MTKAPDLWCVYMLRCADGSIYTGISNNVEERVKEHNTGRGAKYTRQRRPLILIYQEEQPDQSTARQREEQIKRWGKEKKENLALGFPRRNAK
jgi:predicted GIY-YIG superfamily endonuclease